jgi:hypothetical protein
MNFFQPQQPASLLSWLCLMRPAIDYELLITTSVTSINYAAMFRQPVICNRLLEHGQSYDAISPFGTPLQLALTGPKALTGNLEYPSRLGSLNVERNSALLETIQVFLARGADIHGYWQNIDRNQTRSILALTASNFPCTGVVFQTLLAMGARIDETCIEVLRELSSTPGFFKFIKIIPEIKEENIDTCSIGNFKQFVDAFLIDRNSSLGGTQLAQVMRADGTFGRRNDFYSEQCSIIMHIQWPSYWIIIASMQTS